MPRNLAKALHLHINIFLCENWETTTWINFQRPNFNDVEYINLQTLRNIDDFAWQYYAPV